MGKVPFCEFGKQVGKRLVDLDKSQKWLIDQVRADTGLYLDRSYMHKIKTGKLATPSIVTSICKILDIPAP